MDKVGVLVVTKCLSGAAIIDTLGRSEHYEPEFYVVAKQLNPFIAKKSRVHHVVPELDLRAIAELAKTYSSRLSFGLTDTEDFVTAGGRDYIEEETGVKMICVTAKYAVEKSKADQRLLFDRIFRSANPDYRIFDPKDYDSVPDARRDFMEALEEIPQPVVKPDAPARGAGVGVWGSDFRTSDAAAEFFLKLLSKGRVVVEGRAEGEESSFHAFSDGRHFIPAPLSRDYKRSLDGNEGSLTGGMGSYRGPSDRLPFLRASDWEELVTLERRAFERWKGRGSNPALRGVVLYDAIMHTGDGFKVLERNSRGGNTEFINLLTTMKDDFADLCFRILDGSLKGINFERRASVVTCAVPLSYGTKTSAPSSSQEVDLSVLEKMESRTGGNLRAFPMDVRLEDGRSVMGRSRTVAVVGLGASTDDARLLSLSGCKAIRGPVRWRTDVASPADIGRSRGHLARLLKAP